MKNQEELETIPVYILYVEMNQTEEYEVTFKVTLSEDAPVTDFVDEACEMLDTHIAKHHPTWRDWEILDIA